MDRAVPHLQSCCDSWHSAWLQASVLLATHGFCISQICDTPFRLQDPRPAVGGRSLSQLAAGDYLVAFLQQGLQQHAIAVRKRAEAWIASRRRLTTPFDSRMPISGSRGRHKAEGVAATQSCGAL